MHIKPRALLVFHQANEKYFPLTIIVLLVALVRSWLFAICKLYIYIWSNFVQFDYCIEIMSMVHMIQGVTRRFERNCNLIRENSSHFHHLNQPVVFFVNLLVRVCRKYVVCKVSFSLLAKDKLHKMTSLKNALIFT